MRGFIVKQDIQTIQIYIHWSDIPFTLTMTSLYNL